MRRFLSLVVAALLTATVITPALAWELDLRAEFELRFQYFARMGNRDLFGLASLQNAVPGAGPDFIGFAGPSIYGRGASAPVIGNNAVNAFVQITRGGFSRYESDASWNDMRLTLYPSFTVNRAIKVFGVYNIGGYRNKYAMAAAPAPPAAAFFSAGIPPFERYYMSQTSMNAYDTAAVGSWEQFAINVNTPLGIVTAGVRDFPFGTGATLSYNTRAEQLMLTAPYGPFKFSYGVWLSRGGLLYQEGWNTVPDSGTKRRIFQTILMSYESGPVDIGAATIFSKYHGNSFDAPAGLPDAGPGTGLDETTWVNLVYFKYNNGRFFANAEYAWLNIDRFRPVAAAAFAFPTQRYLEGSHAYGEVGVMSGPAKFTAMCGWVPGRQRWWLATAATERQTPNPTKVYIPFPLNYSGLEGYNFSMFHTYGGGNPPVLVPAVGGRLADGFNGGFVADGTGMLADALAFAGRLDYAVAANLNIWGSYIWATRLEKDGYFAGEGVGLAVGGWTDSLPGLGFVTPYGGSNPFASNRFLGWEVNVGVDWKLLEGLTMSSRYAYWQMGEWFDFGYQAATPGFPTGGGILRGRDPIQVFRTSFLINF